MVLCSVLLQQHYQSLVSKAEEKRQQETQRLHEKLTMQSTRLEKEKIRRQQEVAEAEAAASAHRFEAGQERRRCEDLEMLVVDLQRQLATTSRDARRARSRCEELEEQLSDAKDILRYCCSDVDWDSDSESESDSDSDSY
eukprot:m.495601 g.495601  ORF g.495601 m.495601 type:complete len:140 (+) comp44952_c0_seq1:212-631(+)